MTVTESSVEQQEIVAAVKEFVDRDVIPVASELEHADEFPTALVETMKQLGLFGTTIPEEYGGLGLGLDTYALIVPSTGGPYSVHIPCSAVARVNHACGKPGLAATAWRPRSAAREASPSRR